MKLEIDGGLTFKYKSDFVNLHFDVRDVIPKDINLPIEYDGTRTIGGGDYIYRAFYKTDKFAEYNHIKFNNRRSTIELQVDGEISNKVFECDTIVIGVMDDNKTIFKNCKFICNELWLSAKMDYLEMNGCDFSELKKILL